MTHHELTMGDLPLSGWIADSGTDEGYRIGVYSDGVEFGSSEAVVETVRSFWADGSSVRRTGSDNGTTTFRVEIQGTTHQEIYAGEAALRRALPDDSEHPVDLVWRPADGISPASVRRILLGTFEQEWSGFAHLRYRHVYAVTLVHEPHVRSEFPSTVPALPSGPVVSTVVIDTCDSATGWTGALDNAPFTVFAPSTVGPAGSIGPETFSSDATSHHFWTLRRAGVIDFTTTRYLRIESRVRYTEFTPGPEPVPFVSVGGVFGLHVSSTAASGGFVRHVYDMGSAGSPSGLRIDATSPIGAIHGLQVRHVERSNSPTFGNAKMSTRRFAVGGTERTTGALRISKPGGTLGKTAIFTSPVDRPYEPCLSPYRTVPAGAGTAGADSPTGEWVSMNGVGAVQFSIPSSALPQDMYSVMALVKRTSGAGDVAFTFDSYTTLPGSGATKHAQDLRERTVSIPTGIHWISLGLHTLPTVRTDAGNSGFGVWAGSSDLLLGGLWAFRAGDDCALTITDTGAPYLWINAPSIVGAGGPWVSPTNEVAAGWYPPGSGTLPEPHTFVPGEMQAHVVTLGAENVDVELQSYQRWTYNPADEGERP